MHLSFKVHVVHQMDVYVVVLHITRAAISHTRKTLHLGKSIFVIRMKCSCGKEYLCLDYWIFFFITAKFAAVFFPLMNGLIRMKPVNWGTPCAGQHHTQRPFFSIRLLLPNRRNHVEARYQSPLTSSFIISLP